MALDESCAHLGDSEANRRKPAVYHGGPSLYYIVIDDGIERAVYLNADAPRLIEASDQFESPG